MNEGQESVEQVKKTRKKRVRSPYMFPAYDFGTAKRIAETVERDGAGKLTEETLAIALGVSAKSSGYRLKTLAARQFKLLIKSGENLSTTPLSKAIVKPTNETERTNTIVESFMAIPLFRAVATKYKGQPLPQGQSFRNILEREFGIDGSRVSDAERVLMDSAREAGVLTTSGTHLYLSVEKAIVAPLPPPLPPPALSPPPAPSPPYAGMLTISVEDLSRLNGEEFQEVWNALGKIVKAKGKLLQEQKEVKEKEEVKTKEETGQEIE